jgi:hypothetical protein
VLYWLAFPLRRAMADNVLSWRRDERTGIKQERDGEMKRESSLLPVVCSCIAKNSIRRFTGTRKL